MNRSTSVPKTEYPAILAMADVDRVKTVDIAKRYGVVPRTICIILNKARGEHGQVATPVDTPVLTPVETPVLACEPLRQSDPLPEMPTPSPRLISDATAASVVVAAAGAPVPLVSSPVQARREEVAGGKEVDEDDVPVRSLSKGQTNAATGSKRQGHTLLARTVDGDETAMPFGSLDELLSSLRGVFRQAAQGNEQVWFSVRKTEPGDFDA